MARFVLVNLCLVLIPFLVSAAAAGDNWPQFRGPGGSGRSDAKGLPLRWSEDQNVVWKTKIHGKGWSPPVIWDGQVWMTTATPDGKQMFAICVDAASGKVLHDIKLWDVAKPGFAPALNSYASPTPAIEEGRVYLHFGSYGTVCLDTRTAKRVWMRRDLSCDHYRGPGSSPILFEDLLVLTFDGYDQQYVVALNKQSGKTVWRRDRDINYGTNNGDLKKAFSTPALVPSAGGPQLVSPSAVGTIAYEPRSGKELWKVHHGGMNAAAVPLFGHGMVYVSSGHGGWGIFAARTTGRGDVTKSHVAWKYKQSVPSRPSQLLLGEDLYMVDNRGVATCLEAKTGKMIWRDRVGGNYCASPLYADGKIYFFSQEGKTTVIKPGRKFERLADNQLADGFMASPAVAGKALFLRTKTHLYRIEGRAVIGSPAR